MLENSILASNVIFLSVCHSKKIIDKYFKVLSKILEDIHNFENNKGLDKLNKVPVCHSGFKRLN